MTGTRPKKENHRQSGRGQESMSGLAIRLGPGWAAGAVVDSVWVTPIPFVECWAASRLSSCLRSLCSWHSKLQRTLHLRYSNVLATGCATSAQNVHMRMTPHVGSWDQSDPTCWLCGLCDSLLILIMLYFGHIRSTVFGGFGRLCNIYLHKNICLSPKVWRFSGTVLEWIKHAQTTRLENSAVFKVRFSEPLRGFSRAVARICGLAGRERAL